MGRDIHAILQIKSNENGWKTIPEIPNVFRNRCYMMFDALHSIAHRGLPLEAKGEKHRYDEEWDYWEVDFSDGCEDRYYGFGWTTLEDFQRYVDYYNPYYVSVAFYDMFIELGGKFPEAMVSLNYDGENKILFDVIDEDEEDEITYFLSASKEFGEVAELYGLSEHPENIRVVFAFDC